MKALRAVGVTLLCLVLSVPVALAIVAWFYGTLDGSNTLCGILMSGKCGPDPSTWTVEPFLLTLLLMILSGCGAALIVTFAYHLGQESRR